MAKRTLLECDACGSIVDVETLTGRRGSIPYTGDLCPKCWSRLVEEFSIKTGSKGPKREFHVYSDISDIPK